MKTKELPKIPEEVGFTGTREGLTEKQYSCLNLFITKTIKIAHMGDCIGSDEEFFYIVRDKAPKAKCFGHIPTEKSVRAFCEYDEERKPKPYLDRNRDVVDECKLLIATPKSEKEEGRGSGTWFTIRYARNAFKPVLLIFPDGSFKYEENKED